MTTKELLKIAKKIAKYEMGIAQATSQDERDRCLEKIEELTSKITNLNDLLTIDIYVQEILDEI